MTYPETLALLSRFEAHCKTLGGTIEPLESMNLFADKGAEPDTLALIQMDGQTTLLDARFSNHDNGFEDAMARGSFNVGVQRDMGITFDRVAFLAGSTPQESTTELLVKVGIDVIVETAPGQFVMYPSNPEARDDLINMW